jgi:hypothetical protein
LEERRAARRYKLTLQIEIRLEPSLKEFEPILGRTRDISTHGFYFRSDQEFSVGMKFWFSIMPPWEVAQATHAFISGQARVMRVEEVSESNVDRTGVGAMIERYKFGQTESSAHLTDLTFENSHALPDVFSSRIPPRKSHDNVAYCRRGQAGVRAWLLRTICAEKLS